MSIKRWILPQQDGKCASELAEEMGLEPVLCRVLAARGYTKAGQARELLHSDAVFSDPYKLRDMDKAVSRIRSALESGDRIAVFGDYDCDGITSTALLVSYLQDVGADVLYYVPTRESEGYGLNRAAIDMLSQQQVTLIITVDNGISAHEEIAYASTLGMDVVVTDHHTPRETLPAAVAVVDAHRQDDESGLTQLAGVGIVFKLICALEEDPTGEEMLEYYSDLVTIGTVADVVPLTGENRYLVRHGLTHLEQTGRAGLSALMEQCGLEGKTLAAETVAFTIAPRLNATGRMGTVDEAIELLLTDDVRYAREIAQGIEEQNALRRETEDGVLAAIEEMLGKNPALLQGRLLMVAGEGWHHGVVGIVAAKLMERIGKPVIVFSTEGGVARGSARSLPGFSMIEAVSACARHLTRYGGHPLAAGMTLPTEHLDDFMASMEEYAAQRHPQMPVSSLEIDCVLGPRELTVERIQSLSVLEPYGAGNPLPLFLLEKLTIQGIYPTADGRHIRIGLVGDGASFTAVYFRMAEGDFPYIPGDVIDLVASVSVSLYNGKAQVSVIIRDLRRSGIPQDSMIRDSQCYACHRRGEYGAVCGREELLPTRDDIAVVYRYLKMSPGYRYGTHQLYYRLADSGISYAKMLVALDVLEEMGLVTRWGESGEPGLFCSVNPPKVNLESSAILAALKER